MKVRPHKGKDGPDLQGRYIKFMLDAAFLVSEPGSAADERLPFVVMHMRKPPPLTRDIAREPNKDTAEEAPVDTPTDALPAGHLAAAAGTTPERPESHEEVTRFIERLDVVGKAASSDGWTGAGEGGAAASGDAAACAQCGIRSVELKHCLRCFQVAYCGKE